MKFLSGNKSELRQSLHHRRHRGTQGKPRAFPKTDRDQSFYAAVSGVCLKDVDEGSNFVSSQPTPGKLSPDLMQALRPIKSVRLFPKGATLFQQGSVVTGVYLAESGEVRDLLRTGHSAKQLLEVVGPGTRLGLSESMTGEKYRVTAGAGGQ